MKEELPAKRKLNSSFDGVRTFYSPCTVSVKKIESDLALKKLILNSQHRP